MHGCIAIKRVFISEETTALEASMHTWLIDEVHMLFWR